MSQIKFKTDNTLEKRKAESKRILDKYPDRVPIIVDIAEKSTLGILDKKKYLTPSDLTIGQFVFVIRKRLAIKSEQSIFLFVNNTLPPASTILSQIYKEHKDEDGFLYITVSAENSFGQNGQN